MHQKNKTTTGFTLIELMLATVFIGSLLLVITLVILQVTSIYNTGLTIKEVNSVSRVVVRDMQQSIMNSDVFALRYYKEVEGKPKTFVARSFKEASENNTDYYSNDAGGRFCTGTYSYAWNTGAAVKKYNDNKISDFGSVDMTGKVQFIKNGVNSALIKFVKIRDTQKHLCKLPLDVNEATARWDDYEQNLPKGDNNAKYQNIFGEGNNNLVLYKMSIDAPGIEGIENTGGVSGMKVNGQVVDLKSTAPFYNIGMIVGTQAGDEGTIATSGSCKPPSEASVNRSEYCAVNKIDFVARSGAAGK